MSKTENRLKIRSDFAEYPPINLSKHQMSAVMYLFSSVVEEQHRRFKDNDVEFQKTWDEAGKIANPQTRMAYLEKVLYDFKTYKIDADEFFSFFIKDADLKDMSIARIERRIYKVIKDLLKLDVTFSNIDEKGETEEIKSVNFFQEVSWNKKKKSISMTFSLYGHDLLFNLDKSFLQLKYSDFVPSSKYSWGIYMYMRRKLHYGEEFYTEIEDLDKFKERFGLEQVKTYERWYDLKRRVLDVLEKDCKTSNDITVSFTGLTNGTCRKISKIRYSIKQVKTTKINAFNISTLSISQQAAYHFLTKKGIFESVIVNQILADKDMRMSEIIGYEDLFLKALWARFVKVATGKNKAAIFVDWWKKGTLKSAGGGEHNNSTLFFDTFEGLVEYKKKNKRT